MASVLLSETVCIGEIDFKGADVLNLNGAFLISLLEDSQGIENDDEKLISVMRSLEAEINPDMSMDGSDSEALVCGEYYEEDIEFLRVEETDSQGFFEELENGPNFRWVDEEMVPSSPSDDDLNWCIEVMENEILEFESCRDYYQMCTETILEDHSYGSLWQ